MVCPFLCIIASWNTGCKDRRKVWKYGGMRRFTDAIKGEFSAGYTRLNFLFYTYILFFLNIKLLSELKLNCCSLTKLNFLPWEFLLPYALHYKPQLVFFFTQFSLCLRLILQTIYVCTKNGNSSFFKLKIRGL